MSNSGRLFLVSAPSGAGKTSLVRDLVANEPRLKVSVSLTTRAKRRNEVDGEDYIFVSEATFADKVAAGHFLEHARVFDHQYGTARDQVEAQCARGNDVLLEIDWQGSRQVRTLINDAIGIYILPPSRAELERRLRGRGTDANAVIERRLHEAQAEMSHWQEFDYIVVNDQFDRALEQLAAIVHGHGDALRSDRAELATLTQELLAES